MPPKKKAAAASSAPKVASTSTRPKRAAKASTEIVEDVVEPETTEAEPPKKRGRAAAKPTSTAAESKPKRQPKKSTAEQQDPVEESVESQPKKRGRATKSAQEPTEVEELEKSKSKSARGGKRVAFKDEDEEIDTTSKPAASVPRGRGRAKKAEIQEPVETEEKPAPKRGRAKKTIDEEPATVEPPKKAARGRAKKVPEEPSAAEESTVEEPPKKAARGRAKKVVEEPSATEEQLEPEPPKKSRARGKRAVEEEPSVEKAPAKGRARSKKVDEETTTTEQVPKKGRGKAKADPVTDTEPEEAPVPTKRGRVKATNTESEKAEPKKRGRKAAVVPEPKPEPESVVEEPVKKKRGATAKAAKKTVEAVEVSEPVDSKKPATKKRGRAAKVDEIQPTPTTVPVLDEATALATQAGEEALKQGEEPSAAPTTEILASDQQDKEEPVSRPKKRVRVSMAAAEVSSNTPNRNISGVTPKTAPARAAYQPTTPGTVIRRPDRRPKTPIDESSPIVAAIPSSSKSQKSETASVPASTPAVTPGSVPKSRPSKRRSSVDEVFFDAQETKKSKPDNNNTGKPAKVFTAQTSKPDRRKTMADRPVPNTPKTTKNVPVPGTAPPKAATGPGRKQKVSFGVVEDNNENEQVEDTAVDFTTPEVPTGKNFEFKAREGAKGGRRKTVATQVDPKTPQTSKSTAIPGTAPPKAATGPGRKPKVSVGVQEEVVVLPVEADMEDEIATVDTPEIQSKVPTAKNFEFKVAQGSTAGRRKTVAAQLNPNTPKTTKPNTIPGTAPPKAASRGRKPKASLGVQAAESPVAIGYIGESSPAQGDVTGISEYVDAPEEPKSPATPQLQKIVAKPPKTAPVHLLKERARNEVVHKKRARVSSPGPINESKRTKLDDSALTQESWDGFWLLKAEPESRIEKGKDVKFSIDDLMNVTTSEPWTGVRNYGARNNMQAMKKGDLAFFYHSNCKVPGVVGIMEIVEEATVDQSAFDPSDPYYDERSSREKPKWFNVHVGFKQKFDHPEKTSLHELRAYSTPDAPLEGMSLFKQTRLSVTKVTKQEWNFILDLAGHPEHKVDIPIPEHEDFTMMTVDDTLPPLPEQEAASVKESITQTPADQLLEEMEDAQTVQDLAQVIVENATKEIPVQDEETKIEDSEIPVTAQADIEMPDVDEFSLVGPSTSMINAAEAEMYLHGGLPPESPMPSSSPFKELKATPVRESPIRQALNRIRALYSSSPMVPSLPPPVATPVTKPKSLIPPATVPAKHSLRDIKLDAHPMSDPPVGIEPTDQEEIDGVDMDSSILEPQSDGGLVSNDPDIGRVGRTYGGDFYYGDSSILTEDL